MAIIKCYPNLLDRVEITKGLVSDLSRKQKNTSYDDDELNKSPCVCVIKSSSELVQQGHILTEILSQCISKDPNGEAYAMELQKQRKRHKSIHHGGVNRGVLFKSIWSWSQSLVEWAGFTESFDSIIVILEVSCIISCDQLLFDDNTHLSSINLTKIIIMIGSRKDPTTNTRLIFNNISILTIK